MRWPLFNTSSPTLLHIRRKWYYLTRHFREDSLIDAEQSYIIIFVKCTVKGSLVIIHRGTIEFLSNILLFPTPHRSPMMDASHCMFPFPIRLSQWRGTGNAGLIAKRCTFCWCCFIDHDLLTVTVIAAGKFRESLLLTVLSAVVSIKHASTSYSWYFANNLTL